MSMDTTKMTLTPTQETALKKISAFLEDKDKDVFVLTGYAGTGKTTLMKILYNQLQKTELFASFHASTGRAAKVLSDKTGIIATTIHSLIYRFNGLSEDFDTIIKETDNGTNILVEDDGQLILNFSLGKQHAGDNMLLVTDESSMISDKPDEHALLARFGTGQLLSDLFTFAPKGKFIFLGDPYQLPPVNDSLSPALNADYLSKVKNKRTICAELTDIVRQNSDNDIITAADSIRQMCDSLPRNNWVRFPLLGYSHILIHKNIEDLIMSYTENISNYGYSSYIMISHSNRKCKQYSLLIRDILGLPADRLTDGDLLLVVQNNICGLMNGDFVIVKKVVSEEYRAGLTFSYLHVEKIDSGRSYTLLLIKELLFSRQANLTPEQQKNLFIDFHIRTKKKHPEIKQKSQQYVDIMRNDPYVNALRATFGYVVTCYKAQGGEWNDVYLDISGQLSRTPPRQNYQWLYTAITRAKENLHIVNGFYLM